MLSTHYIYNQGLPEYCFIIEFEPKLFSDKRQFSTKGVQCAESIYG